MRVKEISQINQALLVLRHFIDLSARLLPFLHELQRLQHPNKYELQNRLKIIDVYQNYEFDTQTSKVLLNSDVLDLIKNAFASMSECRSRRGLKRSRENLEKFLEEHERLQNDWNYIDAN